MNIESLIREGIRLGPYTTLGIGGPARFFAEAFTEDDVLAATDWAAERAVPVFVMGGGSNLLVADQGFSGLVLRVVIKGISSLAEDDKVLVTAGAGEDWDKFVAHCVESNLAGIECLSGIPGLVGGTPVQNVGAYGQGVSETIVAVRVYDRQAREAFTLINAACDFSYRSSIFNTTARDRYVVLEVTYALTPEGKPAVLYPDVKKFLGRSHTKATLKEVREAVLSIRASKAMVITPGDPDCKSVGSFFKNPVISTDKLGRIEENIRHNGLLKADARIPHFEMPEEKVKVPAAWLIEKAGYQKGFRQGRVGISSKHTLAIINRGNATASEVLQLMREIQEKVHEKFGIKLVPEPVFLSADGW